MKYKRNLIAIGLCLILTAAALFVCSRAWPGTAWVFRPGAEAGREAVYFAKGATGKLALTFDANWGNEDTEELLRILKEQKVQATFFLCGSWIEEYPETAVKIHENGHEIGNHGDYHAPMTALDLEGSVREIEGAHRKAKSILGIEMKLFRPPFGSYNDITLEAAGSLGYKTVKWNIDSLDWKNIGKDAQIDYVLNHDALADGSIILFHNDARYTVGSIEQIIEGLRDKGFELVTVSGLLDS